MEDIGSILETIKGRVSFFIAIDGKPAIEIKARGREIVIDIKNPILAIEIGIDEYLKMRKHASGDGISVREKLKKAGFRLVVKYKFIELEL